MNRIQLILFLIYVLSIYTAGISIHYFLFKKRQMQSRALFIGESLLLGSIWVIGLMLALSLVHLYKAPYLWAVVLGQFGFLFLSTTRQQWLLPWRGLKWDAWLIFYLILIGFFFFRNCYFLVDVDSHSTYLYAQKLWLEHGSSIFASPALDMKVFAPHFNAVPYALGLSLFPSETFFPQLTVAFWTIIVTLLVFGYLAFRFKRSYGLAGVMWVLFNDHMFFSGVNAYVIINSALIALLVGVAYNFYEARRSQEPWRFALALIFLSAFLANKYQVFYTLFFFLALGLLIQNDLKGLMRTFFLNRRWWIGVLIASLLTGLWFLKNFLATGCPSFPILAGEMGVLNWTKEMAYVFNKFSPGPLSFLMTVKYFNYMFFWPGINASKVVVVFLTLLPLIIILALTRRNLDKERLLEASYWLSLAVLVVLGLCLVSFVDPRHYRYGIGIMAIACVVLIDLILRHLGKSPAWLATALMFLIAVQGWGIMFHQGGEFKRPAMSDNLLILADKLHMEQMTYYYYPVSAAVLSQLDQHREEMKHVAWDIGAGGGDGLSAFLLPTRPQVGIWYTTVVKWDSYANPTAIARDLVDQGIQGIVTVKGSRLSIESVSDYALRASRFDRRPKSLFYNYDFPAELSEVRY